jgi:hypothetical protein
MQEETAGMHLAQHGMDGGQSGEGREPFLLLPRLTKFQCMQIAITVLGYKNKFIAPTVNKNKRKQSVVCKNT